MLLEESRRRHVGGEHTLLNDLVGVVALDRNDFLDFATGVEYDPGFRGFKIDGTTLSPGFAQQFVEVVEVVQVRQHMRVLLRQPVTRLGIRPLKHVTDLVVGQSRVAVHHRLIEGIATDAAVGTDGHVRHHAQPIHTRVQ